MANNDAADANKAYFNNEAATYDQKHEKTLTQLVEEIRARLDFIGVDWVADDDNGDNNAAEGDAQSKKTVRLLDYACGTGLISRALGPYTTQCVGIDVSENMVATYNKRAENQGLTSGEMRAVQGNLLSATPSPSLADPDLSGFDIAVVGLGFHHFDDPSLAARRLAERLKPGGVLLILDFLPHAHGDANAHPAVHTVRHAGFSEEAVREMYEGAGVGNDFKLQTIRNVTFPSMGKGHDGKRTLFMARGVKG